MFLFKKSWRCIVVQSAFRNLVNTQYKVDGKLVTQAYLTYEQVFNQMKAQLCDEEINMFMAYIVSTKFPTREQQYSRWVASEARKAKRLKEKAAKEPKITIEDVIEANKQFIPQTGKPVYWNGANPEQVKSKKILRVKT